MRKTLFFGALSVLLVASAPANASKVVKDKSAIAACLEAAEHQRRDLASISRCNRALLWEATTNGHDRIATFVNRGIVMMRARRFDAALRDFESALALNPTLSEAWLGKAALHWRAGNSGDAHQAADRAIRFGTSKPALAYLIRGLAHEDSGNVRAAYLDLQRARQLDPNWQQPAVELQRYRVLRD